MLRLLAALALALPVTVAHAAPPGDPWELLTQMRTRLAEGGGSATDFVQTFTPAGFASGEKEKGQLALALPDCLRWDYEEPFPKSFLLCGEVAYHWTAGETVGRRLHIAAREETGLDLFLLSSSELRARYRASLSSQSDELIATLVPLGRTSALREARIGIDATTLRPRWLDYRDAEGNHSRFDFSSYRALADRGAFAPPADVEWREE